MKKVLIINTVGFGYEGISNVIVNYTSNMNKKDISLYFLVFEGNNKDVLKKLCEIGNIIVANRRKVVAEYIFELDKILKRDFDVVHIHGNSGTMALETILCKKNRVKKVIIHNHSMNTNYPMLNAVLKHIAIKQADICLSCSEDAGRWLYGNRPFVVLNNGIKLDRFVFDRSVRADVRTELRIDKEQVIGHVGYFSRHKNHDFLIDIFYVYHTICRNSKLLLIGDGKLKDIIQNKVERLGLSSDVIILERRMDIERMYQAMDVFLFPSLCEGLGMVAIEAQASGLPCITSENVPLEANVTGTMQRIELAQKDKWIEELERVKRVEKELSREEVSRMNCLLIQERGYSIKAEASKLLEIYLAD